MLFGPWMNGVTTFMYNGRFDAAKELELIGALWSYYLLRAAD